MSLLTPRTAAAMLAAAVAALVINGCATDIEEPPSDAAAAMESGISDARAQHYLFDQARGRHDAAVEVVAYRDITEVFPNVEFKAPGEPAIRYSNVLARGTIVDVSPGYGFVVDDSDDPTGIRVEFDNKDALWKTVRLDFKVTSPLSPGVSAGDVLHVGYALNGDADFITIKQAFMSLGDVVLPLDRSPVFGYADELYGIAGNGSLFLSIDSDGTVSLPALDSSEEARMLAPAETLPEVQIAASAPPQTLPAEVIGEGFAPAD